MTTEKSLPTVLKRGLFGVGFCYLAALTMPIVGFTWDIRFGLCLLLLQANFTLFFSMCAIAHSDAKRFFLWAARLRFLTLLGASVVVALHPSSPMDWFGWVWLIGPIWWVSHVLAGAALYLVYEEYRLGAGGRLALVLPLFLGVVVLNPLRFAGCWVLLGCLVGLACQALLFFGSTIPVYPRKR